MTRRGGAHTIFYPPYAHAAGRDLPFHPRVKVAMPPADGCAMQLAMASPCTLCSLLPSHGSMLGTRAHSLTVLSSRVHALCNVHMHVNLAHAHVAV